MGSEVIVYGMKWFYSVEDEFVVWNESDVIGRGGFEEVYDEGI